MTDEIFEIGDAILADGIGTDGAAGREPGEEKQIDYRRDAKKVNASGVSSNSPLATYQHITDKSNPRTEKIIGFVFHHMSGKMTGRACADYFCQTSRQVSSNYCIGYGGDIALNVPENRRAWTTSSRECDQKRITVEISNDGGAPDWHVSDYSIQAAINLAADCCKRNGIKKIYYDGTKSAPVVWHCMYADTDCPGPYLKKLTHYICGHVNATLGSELLGDMDGDGKVTAKDARIALQIAAGKKKATNYQLRVGDLDGDGKIGAGDARNILRIAAHIGIGGAKRG